jgi:hypothetical protein
MVICEGMITLWNLIMGWGIQQESLLSYSGVDYHNNIKKKFWNALIAYPYLQRITHAIEKLPCLELC